MEQRDRTNISFDIVGLAKQPCWDEGVNIGKQILYKPDPQETLTAGMRSR